MKQVKRILSLVMAFALMLPLMTPMSAWAEEGDEHVVVGVETITANTPMNLTEVGTTDWMHITHNEINRKAVESEEMPYVLYTANFLDDNTGGMISFGRATTDSWYYQPFVLEQSGPLAKLEIAVMKAGTPSDLIAELYEITNTDTYLTDPTARTKLGDASVLAADISNNEPFNLDFGELDLVEDTTYVVAISQQVRSDSNYYRWCRTYENLVSLGGSIGSGGTSGIWSIGSKRGGLRVTIGDPVEPADFLEFELVGKMEMVSRMTDSKVIYSWSDGTPSTTQVSWIEKTGGVLSYKNGEASSVGVVSEEAGWTIEVPADSNIQTLTFVSGIYKAGAEIHIYVVDGAGNETLVYTNPDLESTSSSKLLRYTVTVAPGSSIKVYGSLKSKSDSKGNMSIGGIALSTTEMDESLDYVTLLKQAVKAGEAWLTEEIDDTFFSQLTAAVNRAKPISENAETTDLVAYLEYVLLMEAIRAVEVAQASGSYANSYANGMTAAFGWEGDKDAPLAWIDGTYQLRDNGGKIITFGVTGLEANSVSWYNKEGYLPCFVSEYEKNGLAHTIESFADLVEIDGKKYEIAYSRMTTTNKSEVTKLLPRVSSDLIPLNAETANAIVVEPDETVVRDFCIGADRFGGTYAWPTDESLVAKGTWDEHYASMKEYWNNRLEDVVDIKSVPEEYEELINAYKAGYIYTLITADEYELHVSEGWNYDMMYDHDVIGILASLIESGHTANFSDYAEHILKNYKFPDSKWKFSWPFALYLQKTGDLATIKTFFEDQGSITGIKTNTRIISAERNADYTEGPIYLEDGTTKARIMMRTNAIDSQGRWVIDNWSALFGLTTYSYLCDALYRDTRDAKYLTEYDWAQAEYEDLLKSVEAVLEFTMGEDDFDYIPISMLLPNEESARSDVRDANWGAHYLFGRWDWDGYLFGADQNTWMAERVDVTYEYILDAKSDLPGAPYNMGGYPPPNGYESSAYNAGYFSAALKGEEYRDYGIEAYLWMINNSMSGPYGWWEGVDGLGEDNLWDRTSAGKGSGSCQHMWGQSTATKVLIDSFLAEKADGSIIAGRGLPASFNADGERIEISNWLCNAGKHIGFKMTTAGETVTFELTGDELENPVSLELLALVDNIASVSGTGCTFDAAAGTVNIPAATTTVTITMGEYIPPSDTPTASDATAAKTAETQTSVAFTLTSSNTGTWRVYADATGETLATDVAASFSGTVLTLTHTTDLPAGTYYVSVTEEGKSESGRLALTVGAYVAPGVESHTVTFDGNGGTPAASTKTVTAPATTVDALPANPTRAGYTFIGWNTAADGTGTAYTAVTPVGADVTVYAQWRAYSSESSSGGSSKPAAPKPSEPPVVELTGNEGGEVKATTNKDGSVTYTFVPEADKEVLYVRVNGLVVDKNSVTIPAGGAASVVVVCGDPNIDLLQRFADLNHVSEEAVNAIAYVVESGLMGGIDDETFVPAANMSRAMFATVLTRMYGAKTDGYTSSFADVALDSWYGPSVAWVTDMGFVNGIGDGLFAPDRDLTRQELVALVWRFATEVGVDTSKCADLSAYKDVDQLGDWASDAMAWAVGIGLINGHSADALAPTAIITRAEAAIILERMASLLVKA